MYNKLTANVHHLVLFPFANRVYKKKRSYGITTFTFDHSVSLRIRNCRCLMCFAWLIANLVNTFVDCMPLGQFYHRKKKYWRTIRSCGNWFETNKNWVLVTVFSWNSMLHCNVNLSGFSQAPWIFFFAFSTYIWTSL